MSSKAIMALGVAVMAASVQAAPITITQTYRDVNFYEYGVAGGVTLGQVPTGDWIFKGTVDSEAADLSTWSGSGAYELTELTLTQASLGLFDVVITNVPFLFFYPDRFGFSNNVNSGAPWTVIVYEANHFSSADTLEQRLALATTPAFTDPYTSFGPQWTGYELEDGRRLYGWGFGPASTNVSTAVPEPATLALVLAALGVLARQTRRRNAAREAATA